VALPLIQRTDDGGPHARQISLPGGAAEAGDGGAEDTALREAREEIGLSGDSLEVLGTLSELYIEVSNFHITPVVAWYHGPDPETFLWPQLTPQPEEVERIVVATIEELHQSLEDRPVHGSGYRLVVPSYLAEGEVVWGATGMILAEFLSVFEDAAQKSAGRR
jgi:8-oxo-dGTP pyrophosphatase MutT (NUDIX family)